MNQNYNFRCPKNLPHQQIVSIIPNKTSFQSYNRFLTWHSLILSLTGDMCGYIKIGRIDRPLELVLKLYIALRYVNFASYYPHTTITNAVYRTPWAHGTWLERSFNLLTVTVYEAATEQTSSTNTMNITIEL